MNKKKIHKTLKKFLIKSTIFVYNESKLHDYSNNKNTHFKIIILSNMFKNKNLLFRHRKIYEILSKQIKEKIYSISLNTYTYHEWNQLKNKNLKNSICIKKIIVSKK